MATPGPEQARSISGARGNLVVPAVAVPPLGKRNQLPVFTETHQKHPALGWGEVSPLGALSLCNLGRVRCFEGS